MMGRRLAYFPMLINEIKRHFGSICREAPSDDDNFERSPSSKSVIVGGPFWWFTCKFDEKEGGENENENQSLIIPLHFPIGLIFDLVTVFNGREGSRNLPWKLEFHISTTNDISTNYSVFTGDVTNYLPFPDESSLSSFYFSNLKEADHLRSGSARNVMNLTRAEQLQLWDAFKGGEYDRFWRNNQKLLDGPSRPRSIPIKFWLFHATEIFRFQFPVTNPALTVDSLLKTEFPNIKITRAILHGVDLPMETVTIEELNYNWNFADNFLQIILIG